MSFEFHKDRNIYFNLQKSNTERYIVPFIEKQKTIKAHTKVLEVGCRDGGVLKPFLEKGCEITGVEMSAPIIEDTKIRYKDAIAEGRAEFIVSDIHEYHTDKKFDIIILKDVIEHVYGHEKMVKKLRELLADDGVIYFGYPPWQNPFGGHQQVAENKFLAMLPYYHILPNFLYYGILKMAKEPQYGFLKATKETRITIEGFRRLMKKCNLDIVEEDQYLINPMYEVKFGLKPRKQMGLIKNIPYFRNYFTTTCDCLVTKSN